jgi:hypothetical protein
MYYHFCGYRKGECVRKHKRKVLQVAMIICKFYMELH